MYENVVKNVAAEQLASVKIPPERAFKSTEKLWRVVDEINPGEVVSVLNKNNLSEVLIYQRTNFLSKDETNPKWDGESVDFSWYKEDVSPLYISSPEQLAGFREMVNHGNTFKGKTIILTKDIDLNHKQWTPIGVMKELVAVGTKGDKFYKVSYEEDKTFCGIFDGNNHIIRGLSITRNYGKDVCVGFFQSIHNATVKNLIFDDAYIGYVDTVRENIESFYAVAFGYAETCVLTNIITCGVIHTRCGGGIGAIAEDTSITNCVNRCVILAIGSRDEEINVGGIVQQYGLSPEMTEKSKGQNNPITPFMHCIQSGQITLNPRHSTYISAGHLYGKLAYNPKSEPYRIGIDKCLVAGSAIILCTPMFDVEKTEAVFAGSIPYRKEEPGVQTSTIQQNGAPLLQPSNWISNAQNVKIDLMDGLLGRTHAILEVLVNQITNSVLIDNTMVVPGSVNTLVSHSMSYSFNTVDVNGLTEKDTILNLEPYFSYIKKARS